MRGNRTSEGFQHSFLPWVRTGLSAVVDGAATTDASVKGVEGSRPVSVQLLGPSDVTAIDPRAVIRMVPADKTTDFEPNLFPSIEFLRPDFPWMFTKGSSASGTLSPWIVLVAVRKQRGVTLNPATEGSLPSLSILDPAIPSAELPDTSESVAWAHVQIARVPGEPDNAIADLIASGSPRAISRIICPRRLDPDTEYIACLVPAWSGTPPPELLVYFSWEFKTGPEGDFEALVRRLTPRKLDPSVGRRDLDVSAPGFGLPSVEGAVVGIEGALRAQEAPPVDAYSERDTLRALLDEGAEIPAQGGHPFVAPPIHGRWHAAATSVPADGEGPAWLREINLDPGLRAAAGFGAAVVRNEQEDLVTSSWEQLGAVHDSNQALRQAQLADVVSTRMHEKHLARFELGALIQVARGASTRVLVDFERGAVPGRTMHDHVENSAIPVTATSGPFRRITRPHGPLARRLFDERAAAREAVMSTVIALNQRHAEPAPTWDAPEGTVLLDRVATTGPNDPGPYPDVKYERAEESALDEVFNNYWTKPPLKGEERVTGVLRSIGGTEPPLPEPGDETINDVHTAVRAHQKYLLKTIPKDDPPKSALPEEPQPILDALAPRPALERRVAERIPVRTLDRTAEDPFRPMLAHPIFPQPMFQPLAEIALELILPGIAAIPDNTVAVLLENRRFVEAYMLGLNHALGAELLWRGYPTDQRGTSFQRFWGMRRTSPDGAPEDLDDIAPIAEWAERGSAPHNNRPDPLVLVLRGALGRRYANATIYAHAAKWSEDKSNRLLSDDPDLQKRISAPLFQITLGSDVVLVGFDLTLKDARGSRDPYADVGPGWYFVLQEHQTEPRFGLDVASIFGREPRDLPSWRDLEWGDLVEAKEDLPKLSYVPLQGRLAGVTHQGATWGSNAAHMAFITLQTPLRVARHADTLIP